METLRTGKEGKAGGLATIIAEQKMKCSNPIDPEIIVYHNFQRGPHPSPRRALPAKAYKGLGPLIEK